MDQPQARFRELREVDPAVEALLHEAGVHTWEALAKVLDALGQLRGRGLAEPGLEELAVEVAERCSVGGAHPAAPTDGGTAEAGSEDAETVHDEAPVVTSRHHRVVLDAGKAIGGAPRDVALAVPTAALADLGEVAFSASLVAQAVGRGGAQEPPWVSPSGQVGRITPPDPLRLRFADVALRPGVHRLQVRLAVTLRDPVPGPLPLEAVVDEATVLGPTAAIGS